MALGLEGKQNGVVSLALLLKLLLHEGQLGLKESPLLVPLPLLLLGDAGVALAYFIQLLLGELLELGDLVLPLLLLLFDIGLAFPEFLLQFDNLLRKLLLLLQ